MASIGAAGVVQPVGDGQTRADDGVGDLPETNAAAPEHPAEGHMSEDVGSARGTTNRRDRSKQTEHQHLGSEAKAKIEKRVHGSRWGGDGGSRSENDLVAKEYFMSHWKGDFGGDPEPPRS